MTGLSRRTERSIQEGRSTKEGKRGGAGLVRREKVTQDGWGDRSTQEGKKEVQVIQEVKGVSGLPRRAAGMGGTPRSVGVRSYPKGRGDWYAQEYRGGRSTQEGKGDKSTHRTGVAGLPMRAGVRST